MAARVCCARKHNTATTSGLYRPGKHLSIIHLRQAKQQLVMLLRSAYGVLPRQAAGGVLL